MHMPSKPKPKSRPVGRPRVSDKRRSVTVRLSRAEQSDLIRMASIYTGGNVSRWARWALLNCTPTPEQAEALRSV